MAKRRPIRKKEKIPPGHLWSRNFCSATKYPLRQFCLDPEFDLRNFSIYRQDFKHNNGKFSCVWWNPDRTVKAWSAYDGINRMLYLHNFSTAKIAKVHIMGKTKGK